MSALRWVVAVGLLLAAPASVLAVPEEPAQQAPTHPRGADPPAQVARGQFIVKYRDSLTTCAHCLFAQRLRFQGATTDVSDSLDHLHQRFGVRRITPLFRTAAQETTLMGGRAGAPALATLRSAWQLRLQAIKGRHARRSARIPKDVDISDLFHIYLVEVPEDSDILELCRLYQADPHVEYAHPNYLATAFLVPNDPYYSSSGSWGQPYDDLWGLKKIQAAQAWDRTQGSGIVVAVVDTGLDYNHPDIAANVWANPDEIPGNGLDDDGNGYVDDIRGWDFFNGDNDPMDGHGHGTHVAGTIAAVGNNGTGIVGVSPQAKIMPLKGLSDGGSGSIADLADAIVYAAQNGADVINNSWGCSGPCPSNPVAEDAVQTAHGLGAIVVFAAGNSSDDVAYYSPQNMTDPKPITVAATTQTDTPALFTNWGPLLDVAAPGGGTTDPPPGFDPFRNILSLKSSVCSPGMCDPSLIVGSQYVRQAGTSMAAPHASGVAALVVAHRPSFTNEEVRQALRASADDVGQPGFELHTGPGRLNASRALTVDSVLRAQLISPARRTAVSQSLGSVDIAGTAAGPSFRSYELSYAPWGSPPAWIPLGPPVFSPVDAGLVGTWGIGELANGLYLLRLLATATTNWQFQEVIDVALERDPPRPIATGPSYQAFADISGARVVWQDDRNGVPNIYLFDLATNTERRITASFSIQPAISGDQIVWIDYRNSNPDIYLYDLSTETERRITSNPFDQINPDISGDRVVWQDKRNGTYDIYLYELSTNTERRMTTHSADETMPAISGNRIVWEDSRNGTDIYLFDLTTNTQRQLTNHPSAQLRPAISGDRVVWIDGRNGNWDIYLYDLAANTERQITTDPGTQWDPGISGDRIVWDDRRDGNADIYLYSLATDVERQITAHPAYSFFPAVSGDRLVWHDQRNNDDDIYLLEVPSNRPPLLSSIGDQTVNEGAALSLTISAVDPDGDVVAYSASSLPPGASFNSATRTFSWTPTYTQAGVYPVTFTVTDAEGLSDAEQVTMTVLNVNRAPVLGPVGDQTAVERQPLAFTVSAGDPDGEAVNLSAANLPPGAAFNAATGAFQWTPTATQAGEYLDVVFSASDGQAADSETITITVTQAEPPPATGAFQEANGQVVIEAEHYDAKVPRSNHDWVLKTTQSGFAGAGYMEALPNTGAGLNTGYVTTSPELVFNVVFSTTGTYFVWVRGAAPSGNDDSLHAGLDGAGPASADRITSFGTGWTWKRTTMDSSAPATLSIVAPGPHTIHLWMREDGLKVDRILLRTSSSSTAPSGAGPAESPRGAGTAYYYVGPNGTNDTAPGRGSSPSDPWKTIGFAVSNVPDNDSTIVVLDGVYTNPAVTLSRVFATHLTIRAQTPYRAILTNTGGNPVLRAFGGANYTIEGFIIGPTQSVLAVQIADGSQDFTFRNNIFRDSFNNDLLKINDRTTNVLIEGNVFYNRGANDEDIDLNAVKYVTVQDNIFFSDYPGSGRSIPLDAIEGSNVVIKNSPCQQPENASYCNAWTHHIAVRRNVFLNWQGPAVSSFLRLGEDNTPAFEAQHVLIENNLMVGNSPVAMEAPVIVEASRDVTIRGNTIVGDLPSRGYVLALRASAYTTEDVAIHDNLWADPTGTMTAFSVGTDSGVSQVALERNLYWNGGSAIPQSAEGGLELGDDAEAVVGDPRLPPIGPVALPRYDTATDKFLSGQTAIRGEFERLVASYGVPAGGSPAIDAADPLTAPPDDILGRQRAGRGAGPDLGAYETVPPITSAAVSQRFQFAGQQLGTMTSTIPTTQYPFYTSPEGIWQTRDASHWTSGFFPGNLWLMYLWTADPAWRAHAQTRQAGVESQKTNTSTHDVGFMLFNSFGLGHRLTGNTAYRDVVLTAAASLATRYNPVVGCVKSLNGPTSSDFRVWVDNMMNLELLFWGSKHGGDPAWYEMAVSHALRTRDEHVRANGSTYHIVNFDPLTGAVKSKTTDQGYADESTWSRGQAWALYGFTMTYRETGDARFLDTARRLADYFIGNLPSDSVPYWDFNAPGIPNEPKDSSAGAIAASGLLELSRLETDVTRKQTYWDAAQRLLTSLASPAYLAQGTTNQAILLHGTVDKPRGNFDTGLIFGDYYFLEAMLRYESRDPSDITAPTITARAHSGISEQQATITWTTDEPATSQVAYGPTTSYGQLSLLDDALAASHTVTLTGLSPNTLYHYQVRSTDASGNTAYSGDGTFTASAAQASAFQEANGQVVMEAEHFDVNTPRGGKDWTFQTSKSGFSGSGYLTAAPNTGAAINSGYVTTSPELVFNVQFSTTGTYYVWTRGQGDSGNDDSLHAGLDGTGPASADRLQGFNNANWVWKRETMDGVVPTLFIGTPGLHTIHLWMREDGLKVDRLLLRTSSSSTAPSGAGPAESPRIP